MGDSAGIMIASILVVKRTQRVRLTTVRFPPEMAPPSKESYELFKQLHASKGMEFFNRLKVHGFSYHCLAVNLEELRKALKIVADQKVAVQLWNIERREEQLFVHRDVMRLLHNFLAAAKSLVDHTRVFVTEHYKDQSFATTYKTKVGEVFANDELSAFIQDLRNYFLHVGPPSTKMSLSLKPNGPIESKVLLNVEELRSWSKWTSKSRSYLEKQTGELKLSEVIDGYGTKIAEFYQWLETELRKVHADDIAEFLSLQEKYRAMEHPET